ncbi:hypothetical protein PC111_g16823 [Phytophthora cactorum]|nr:hypothetical protein PC112_g18002 [Phytophthora cactorum]KAG2807683.1 hypothetical protein PC111_g16823 [Phytophthora cactorum]KAG2993245.1 hypothetical protein PC120_g22292 [Phytophthora cactorum]KAG4041081.1 hypothetical protein PC123_g23394 [Phytophthora cactorum]
MINLDAFLHSFEGSNSQCHFATFSRPLARSPASTPDASSHSYLFERQPCKSRHLLSALSHPLFKPRAESRLRRSVSTPALKSPKPSFITGRPKNTGQLTDAKSTGPSLGDHSSQERSL